MQTEIFWVRKLDETAYDPFRLAVLPRPRGGDWLEGEVRALRDAGVDVLVSLLTALEAEMQELTEEASYCVAGGIEFISFPIADREVPGSTPDFLGLVRRLAWHLEGGQTVAIHCRQGIGRAALVAACVLAMLGEKPDVALERIAAARGRPVPDTDEQRRWVLRFAETRLKEARGKTLLLSTRALPAAPALAEAAASGGWSVHALDEDGHDRPAGRAVYYGGTDVAREAADRYRLELLSPPLDLLARLPSSLLLREVRFARFRDLSRLKQQAFVKPADPMDKCFDAGTYGKPSDIRAPKGVAPLTPVLVAESVEWLAEYRCFCREGSLIAGSPYLSFGRPAWKAWGRSSEQFALPPPALDLCRRLFGTKSLLLPAAFVVDVGLIADRGWAVVEFNPAWCSALLGANPAAVLGVLERASRDAAGPDGVGMLKKGQ
jgi:protein-tyrosine phosphatase